MIAAVSMVRDEVDIVAETVGHMLQQVDRVYVADNGSVDGTREILEDLMLETGRLQIQRDDEIGYYQSRKMSGLAADARNEGAEWIVPFDADEIWRSRDERRLADALADVPADIPVVEADLYDYVATAKDGVAGSPVERMQWRRRAPIPLPKVAFRAVEGLTVHQGNHGVSFPDVEVPLRLGGLLEVAHYPYRSAEQMIRKARNGAAAYAATDLPEEVGAHWRAYGRLSDEQLTEVFLKFYFRKRPNKVVEIDGEVQPPLVHDPVSLWVASPS